MRKAELCVTLVQVAGIASLLVSVCMLECLDIGGNKMSHWQYRVIKWLSSS